MIHEIEKDAGKNPVVIGRGMIYLPLTKDDDALGCAEFVRLIEQTQKVSIADLYEVAGNRGITAAGNI